MNRRSHGLANAAFVDLFKKFGAKNDPDPWAAEPTARR